MCGGEVLLLQGLDQVWAVLGVNAPERTFSTGLVDRRESQPGPTWRRAHSAAAQNQHSVKNNRNRYVHRCIMHRSGW